ncbi:unnamed protein product, partial [Effrenium voratum]
VCFGGAEPAREHLHAALVRLRGIPRGGEWEDHPHSEALHLEHGCVACPLSVGACGPAGPSTGRAAAVPPLGLQHEPLHIRDAVPVRPWIGQHRGQVESCCGPHWFRPG